ncbi:1230_t:CDS:1, partial [Paraglomus brasilianum]
VISKQKCKQEDLTLPSGGELSTCKGRPPNSVRSSDDELVET